MLTPHSHAGFCEVHGYRECPAVIGTSLSGRGTNGGLRRVLRCHCYTTPDREPTPRLKCLSSIRCLHLNFLSSRGHDDNILGDDTNFGREDVSNELMIRTLAG